MIAGCVAGSWIKTARQLGGGIHFSLSGAVQHDRDWHVSGDMYAAVFLRQVLQLPASRQGGGQVAFTQGKFKTSGISAAQHGTLVIGDLRGVEIGIINFTDQGIGQQQFFVGSQEFSGIHFRIIGVSP